MQNFFKIGPAGPCEALFAIPVLAAKIALFTV